MLNAILTDKKTIHIAFGMTDVASTKSFTSAKPQNRLNVNTKCCQDDEVWHKAAPTMIEHLILKLLT